MLVCVSCGEFPKELLSAFDHLAQHDGAIERNVKRIHASSSGIRLHTKLFYKLLKIFLMTRLQLHHCPFNFIKSMTLCFCLHRFIPRITTFRLNFPLEINKHSSSTL